jgi:hypothetical protein
MLWVATRSTSGLLRCGSATWGGGIYDWEGASHEAALAGAGSSHMRMLMAAAALPSHEAGRGGAGAEEGTVSGRDGLVAAGGAEQ